MDLALGGRGFVVLVPVGQGPRFDGVIAGVFAAESLFSNLLPGVDDLSVEVHEGDALVFARRLPEAAASARFGSSVVPVGAGSRWGIRVVPGAALLERERSLLPPAVLGAGVVVSLLLTIAGLLLDSSLRRSIHVRTAHPCAREAGGRAGARSR
jgi:sensor domain CHASE-containing protein